MKEAVAAMNRVVTQIVTQKNAKIEELLAIISYKDEVIRELSKKLEKLG